MTDPERDPQQRDVQIETAEARLLTLLDLLTDQQVAGPSRLPGWTRGHVLAHLAGLGDGVARQLENARTGTVVEFYDGGRPARDAAIEEGAGAGAHEHRTRLRATVERVGRARAALDAQAAARTTGYRDRPASAVVDLWWRELAIHLTDLDLGLEHTDIWDAPLRDHLAEYLAPRVPAGVQVEIEPWDVDEPRTVGTGEPVVVNGAANDVFAWLAGREPALPIVAERDGVPTELPVLDPWP